MTASPRTCAHCGASFVPGKFQKRMIYCGRPCYNAVRAKQSMAKYYRHHEVYRQKQKEYHARTRDRRIPQMREKWRQTRLELPWRNLFGGAKHRAKVAGMAFDLTDDWAKARWTGNCEISGIPFKLGLSTEDKRMYSPSIDRIRPEDGYTQDNCRFVLFAVNCMRQDGTDEEMYEIAGAIVRLRKHHQ